MGRELSQSSQIESMSYCFSQYERNALSSYSSGPQGGMVKRRQYQAVVSEVSQDHRTGMNFAMA
jgi:hypothetical protein